MLLISTMIVIKNNSLKPVVDVLCWIKFIKLKNDIKRSCALDQLTTDSAVWACP